MKTLPEARVILSFDFEIGWGDVTNPRWRTRQAKGVYTRLRRVLPEILTIMDECEIRASWATVGAMFDRPDRRDFSHLPPKWQALINGVLEEADPESFNGRDLFEMVLESKANHQIACHSYSHVPFTFEGMTSAIVADDLLRFHNAITQYGLHTDRFVFPENREAHFEALANAGYKKARVAADTYFKNRMLYLASTMVIPPPLGREEAGKEGIVRQYGSMLFNDAGKSWRTDLLSRRLSLGLRQLQRKGGVFHIWAHPFNFAESEPLKYSFETALRQMAQLRDEGLIDFSVM